MGNIFGKQKGGDEDQQAGELSKWEQTRLQKGDVMLQVVQKKLGWKKVQELYRLHPKDDRAWDAVKKKYALDNKELLSLRRFVTMDVAVPKRGFSPSRRDLYKPDDDRLRVTFTIRDFLEKVYEFEACLLYTSPSPRD